MNVTNASNSFGMQLPSWISHSLTGMPIAPKTPDMIHTNNRTMVTVKQVFKIRPVLPNRRRMPDTAPMTIISRVKVAPTGVNTHEKNSSRAVFAV